MAERTTDGRPIRILNIIDEHTRECLATYVARQIKAADVLYILSELFVLRGAPDFIRSDNGFEFTAGMVREGDRIRTCFGRGDCTFEDCYEQMI